jgi:hypothetical protein
MATPTRIFRWAGIYGLVVLVPTLFTEIQFGRDNPPPVTHPEFYYGFAGVALAWQVAFLVIASDPPRYRPLMPAAVLEKLGFAAAVLGLLIVGRKVPGVIAAGAGVDFLLGLLFVHAWRRTAPEHA